MLVGDGNGDTDNLKVRDPLTNRPGMIEFVSEAEEEAVIIIKVFLQ